MRERLERTALAVLGAGARVVFALSTPSPSCTRFATEWILRSCARGRPVLRGHSDGVELRGFLRHRFPRRHHEWDPRAVRRRRVLMSQQCPGSIFVDVGAHLGLYTLRAAGRIGPEGRIVAFEADPYTATALCCERQASRLGNVRVVPKAVSDHVGSTAFWLSAGTYKRFRSTAVRAWRASNASRSRRRRSTPRSSPPTTSCSRSTSREPSSMRLEGLDPPLAQANTSRADGRSEPERAAEAGCTPRPT